MSTSTENGTFITTPTVETSPGDDRVVFQTPSTSTSALSSPNSNSRPNTATPPFNPPVSPIESQTSFVNTLYEGDDDDVVDNEVPDEPDGCITPEFDPDDPEAPENRGRFRRGWAASSLNDRTTSGRSFQSSTRSNKSIVEKYKSEYSQGRKPTKTDEWKEEHPNRPSGARWKQQRLPAWQPALRPVNVVSSFIGFGLLCIAIGVFMIISTKNTKEYVYDYTHCAWVDKLELTCAKVLEDYQSIEKPCKCRVPVSIPEPMATPVYIYYNLDGFYQNHRRYVSSVNHDQLLGKSMTRDSLRSVCYPFATVNDGNVQYAPCGAIANSMFSDKFNLKQLSDNSTLTIKQTDIAWITDKMNRYKNPPDMNFRNTEKPLNWTVHVQDLDPKDPDNNGYQNEHLIVWMRTAAFPWFRKLWGRVEPQSISIKPTDPLPAGNYVMEIDYMLGKLNIPKKFIISNTSWLGGRNLFLPILYVVVGGLCLLLGLGFLFLVWKVKRNQERIRPDNSVNYQSMSNTEGARFTNGAVTGD